MKTNIEELLKKLDEDIPTLIGLGKSNAEAFNRIYWLDIYFTGILNRSVNLVRAFTGLIRDKNFIAAAPLVRIHLDSLLRTYAPWIIDYNPDEFAKKVYQGKSVRSLKDSEGVKMTDRRLVNKLKEREDFEWVEKVYDAGNGFVHYSDSTIFCCTKLNNESRTISNTIGPHDSFIDVQEKYGAAFWMVKINEGIMDFIQTWGNQKKSYSQ